MEITPNFFLSVFAFSLFVSLVSSFYSIFEYIMAIQFSPSVFAQGVLVLEMSEVFFLDRSRILSNCTIETKNGQFKFIDDTSCLFRPKCQRRYALFGPRPARTPFPIRGRIRWQEGMAQIEGRIPVGTSIFFLGLLIGSTSFALNMLVSEPPVYGIMMLGISWMVIAGICLFSVGYEEERARIIVDELREFMS